MNPLNELPEARHDRAGTGLLPVRRDLVQAPVRLDPPQVDPGLEDLSAPERSAEVLRYSLLAAEHRLAPDGTLRRTLRRTLRLAAAVGIPALALMPLALWLSGSLADCVGRLDRIREHPFGIGAVAALALLTAHVLGRLRRPGPR